jgi:hypothetical protein
MMKVCSGLARSIHVWVICKAHNDERGRQAGKDPLMTLIINDVIYGDFAPKSRVPLQCVAQISLNNRRILTDKIQLFFLFEGNTHTHLVLLSGKRKLIAIKQQ